MRHMIEHLRGIYHYFLFLSFSLHLLWVTRWIVEFVLSLWFGLDWWFSFVSLLLNYLLNSPLFITLDGFLPLL